VIVGSVMPWATVKSVFGEINVSGTDGDGVLTLVGGVVVLVLVLAQKYLASLIVATVTAAVLIYDYLNITRSLDLDDNEFASASVGWGIQLATIGAVVAVIASFLARRDSPSGADSAEEPNAGPHRP